MHEPDEWDNIHECSASPSTTHAEEYVGKVRAIFHFLDLSKINLALWKEEAKFYITMFSNQSLPFIVSITYWLRLGELEPMYRIKTMIATHQCITWTTVRTPRTFERVPNDYLNPNTSSMKMVAWNCQGVGNEAFHTHAHKLYHLYCPQILIIVESHIADNHAQVVIDISIFSFPKG